MTRGHRGSLLLRCRALSSLSSCRFIPALSSRSVQEPRPGSRRLHAGRHLGSQQAPPRLLPGPRSRPGFDATVVSYDTSSAVRSRSPSWPTPDAISVAPFPQRSPRPALNRRSLRWFGASPCRATPEDLPLSPAQHRIQQVLHHSRTPFCVRDTRPAQTLVVFGSRAVLPALHGGNNALLRPTAGLNNRPSAGIMVRPAGSRWHQGAPLSLDDFGSSVERTAKLHPL